MLPGQLGQRVAQVAAVPVRAAVHDEQRPVGRAASAGGEQLHARRDHDELLGERFHVERVHRGQRASTSPSAAVAACSSATSTYSSTACMTAGVPGPHTTIGASPTTGRSTEASVK
ncbi:hypothetical protein SAMN05661080_03284 [Modestobacter sp. DSM 44400]|nr:hypothetical protein SAMN05661080_03284 [Modestobacter sp. DSM 44400]